MFERINNKADSELATTNTKAELADHYPDGQAMSADEAATLLEKRSLATVTQLHKLAGTIGVTDILDELSKSVTRLAGFSNAQLDYLPFLWAPKPKAMRSLKPTQWARPYPTETYGVAGWHLYWRNCQLPPLTLLLFQNGDEVKDTAAHAALISTASHTGLLNSMFEEGINTVKWLTLGVILDFVRKALPSIRQQPHFELTATGEGSAMYYLVLLLFMDLQPLVFLQAICSLLAGRYDAIAELLDVPRWPVRCDGPDHTRDYENKFITVYQYGLSDISYPVRSNDYQYAFGKLFHRLGEVQQYGHYRSFTTAQGPKQLIDFDQIDKAPQFRLPPYLFRSVRRAATVQEAFALPDRTKTGVGKLALWKTRGGDIGRLAIPLDSDSPAASVKGRQLIAGLLERTYAPHLGV